MTPEELSKGKVISLQIIELRREIRSLSAKVSIKITVEAKDYSRYYDAHVRGGLGDVFDKLKAAKEADLTAKEAELAAL